MARCVILLIDGLRPDAVVPDLAPSLYALGQDYTRAEAAVTVRPSTTVAALLSLTTGVGPDTHKLVEPGLATLRRLGSLRPVPRELAARQLPTVAVAGEVASVEVPVARVLVSAAGVSRLVATAGPARRVAAAALGRLRFVPDGLVIVYVNDCDRAGHTAGWMSAPYLDAVREADAAVARLRACTADSLLVVLADHGGGGVHATDHDTPHPVNDRIPLVLAGPRIRRRHVLRSPTSILDVPPTLLWWLGLEVPAAYEGRVLREAFVAADELEAVA
ncbi:MAG TPA: alkaline phosphatase family protein [Gemmatimonadales bacterium]|nr:alkaline phosphatase family protein [Gemmatimonadales bacterium]